MVLVYSFKAVSFLDRKAIPQSVKMINDDVLKNPSGEEVFVTLCHWADVCLFAPITANTLAKLANGLCDTLMVLFLFFFLVFFCLSDIMPGNILDNGSEGVGISE